MPLAPMLAIAALEGTGPLDGHVAACGPGDDVGAVVGAGVGGTPPPPGVDGVIGEPDPPPPQAVSAYTIAATAGKTE